MSTLNWMVGCEHSREGELSAERAATPPTEGTGPFLMSDSHEWSY